jgi:hypothetical protein
MIWAKEQSLRVRRKGKAFEPAVVGAVIDLGKCLDLLNATSIGLVEKAYRHLKEFRKKENLPLPANVSLSGSTDYLLRNLDCAVINFLHKTIARNDPFDCVRAAFLEGEPIYQNAGFRRKSHIQICVRNPSNIRGYFHPFD